MLNKKPIFIVGLSRGGSSILLNILRSHPDVCSPRGETQEVMYGKSNEPLLTRVAKVTRYIPIMLRQREHLFSPHSYHERRPLSPFSISSIDHILFNEKSLATGDTQNRYKAEDVEYTAGEIQEARLLSKNIDGLVFTTPLFADMYPGATFFGLVRNGLAVCEGHIRRGSTASEYGKLYARVCGQLLSDSRRLDNFHLFRYEELTQDTLKTSERIFELADLDSGCVPKFRLVVGNEGDRGRTGGSAVDLRWFSPQEFAETITPGVDEEQIQKLSSRSRDEFLQEAGDILNSLGYAT
jgi:hypothetical protein